MPPSLPLISPFGLPAAGYPASARWHVFNFPASGFRPKIQARMRRSKERGASRPHRTNHLGGTPNLLELPQASGATAPSKVGQASRLTSNGLQSQAGRPRYFPEAQTGSYFALIRVDSRPFAGKIPPLSVRLEKKSAANSLPPAMTTFDPSRTSRTSPAPARSSARRWVS